MISKAQHIAKKMQNNHLWKQTFDVQAEAQQAAAAKKQAKKRASQADALTQKSWDMITHDLNQIDLWNRRLASLDIVWHHLTSLDIAWQRLTKWFWSSL